MKDIGYILQDNAVLFAIVVTGAAILATGSISPHSEMLQALGAAFIIAGSVGIYMMLATRQVAKNLHKQFNNQNKILEMHTEILKDIASSQKDIASSQKDIASSQKDIASSQKDIASSQNQNHSEMIDVLKKIENKL